MSRRVVVKPPAQREFDEAFEWYHERSAGLAIDFAAEVKRDFDAISSQPEIYGFVYKQVRAARVKTYSYAVYFVAEPSVVIVISVLHTARDPAIWQSRVP